MTLLQIRPVLTSYLLLRPNSTIDSLRQICNCTDTKLAQPPHSVYSHPCTPNRFEAGLKPPPGSGLRTSVMKLGTPKVQSSMFHTRSLTRGMSIVQTKVGMVVQSKKFQVKNYLKLSIIIHRVSSSLAWPHPIPQEREGVW